MKIKVLSGLSALFLSALLFVSCGPNDEKIKQMVSDELTETSLPIDVSVHNGNVSLSGTVETDEQKAKAEEVVKPIQGVKTVINNITVTPPPPVVTPDDALKNFADELLAEAGFSTVTTSVADSVITLTGDVKKADVKKIVQVANNTSPKKVVNNLKAK